MSLTIERVQSPTADARLLIGELDAELNAAYPPEQRHGFDVERVFQPGIQFFIARMEGEPAGCGGVAIDGALAELKRMYVRPAARGRGVADALLARLKEAARAGGARRLALETGDVQLAALRFYARAGFAPCVAFGAYTSMSANAVERSVFMGKDIDP